MEGWVCHDLRGIRRDRVVACKLVGCDSALLLLLALLRAELRGQLRCKKYFSAGTYNIAQLAIGLLHLLLVVL